MNFSRNKVWIIPLLLIASYPLWSPLVGGFLAPRESKIVFAKKSANDDNRNLHLYGVNMSQSTGDKLEVVLKAGSVATGGSGIDEYHFTEIDCQFYDDKGLPTHVKGGEALFENDKKLVTIVDDVVVESGDNKYRVKTQVLRYFIKYKVAKTAAPIIFNTDGTEICGNSMMYNLNTGAFRVGGGVICEL